MTAFTLKACREYSSFKLDQTNRTINASHVERLGEAIDATYLLDAYPIVTTPERVIIDGQHRFTTAKEMRIPFYFISGDDVSVEDIAEANACTVKYRPDDALYVYSRMGIESYIELANLRHANPGISVVTLAAWGMRDYNLSDFLSGEYTLERRAYASMLAERLNDFAEVNKWVYTSGAYKRAIQYVSGIKAYDHAHMIKRLKSNPTKMQKVGAWKEAVKILSGIYNMRNREDERIALDKISPSGWEGDDTMKYGSLVDLPARGMVLTDRLAIYQECDLTKFTIHPSARPQRDIKKLVDYMARRNLLEYYPIIVDHDMVVYDGQRRLVAAQKLGLPIYYIKLQNVSMSMIARAGGVDLRWSMRNYLDHFVKRGYAEYIYLQKLLTQYPYLSIHQALSAGLQGGNLDTIHLFRSGVMKLDRDTIQWVLRVLTEIASHHARKKGPVQAICCGIMRKYKSERVASRLVFIINGMNEDELVSLPESRASEIIVEKFNSGLAEYNHIEYGMSKD